MWSSWDRLMAVSTYGPPGSEEEDDPDTGWDFSGLRDPSAMQDVMTACDYCLSGCSDDGHSLDDEGCGPSRECFHIDLGDRDVGNHLGMPEDDDPPVPASRVDIPRELAVVPLPTRGQDTQLKQIREMQAKLDEEAGQLVQLRQNIEQEWAGRALAREARHRARDVQCRIVDDARARLPPASSGVSQNLAAAAILLRAMPEPSTIEGRHIQGELKNLLEDAVVRWAESSASRRQGCPSEHHATTSRLMREASVHTGRTRDGTPAAPGRLGNEQHHRDRRARLDERVRRGYHPRRGGRYDSEEDRSPSPEPLGLQAFSRAIRRAPFPARFRALTTVTKYSGETRPKLWLADYRLACQLGGTDDDNLIIRNLPLFLSDTTRAWLEHLPPAQISNWDDLVKAFAGNFQEKCGKGQDNKKGGNKEEEFPEVHGCFMIYGGQVANASARHRKQERQEVCSVKVATPVYLDWSDKPITFDQGDHPDCVPSPGRYPLVVDPVIGNARLTKVLMDGGSILNIIYVETLGLLEIDLSTIRAGAAPFHGIIPGKRVQPLGQLDLPVCFGTPSNFRRETLTFEVVGFRGTYHAVLGRPCYAKFMAIPSYTYLKLKMPGPNGVITIGSTYRHAYKCDVECMEYAEALAESEALIADLECLSKEVPNAKHHAGNFEPAEAVKSVALDPSSDADKQIGIGSELDPK
jgi:hypothetical protein